MKKKLLVVLMASLMALSAVMLASCGGGSNNSSSSAAKSGNDAKQVLSVQIGPNPETLDPALNSAVDGGNMILHAFECLLTIDKNGAIQPGQAESWQESADGLTWTFNLRDGLKWSDGSDLTAADFEYTWKRVCDPKTAAPYAETVLGMVAGYDQAIEGNTNALQVKAVDPKTLEVKLTAPCPFFDKLAAFAALSPVQKATIEKNGDAWSTKAATYVSNGPFYITEWELGSHITMSKNPNYWNADAIKLEAIKFNLIEDANAAYSAYRSGEVKLIKDVPTEEIPSLKGKDEFKVDPIIGTYYLNLNIQKPMFSDSRVRKALSLAIDRDYVANTIMQGTYSPAYNFVGPGWKDTDGTDFIKKANGGKTYLNENYDADLEEAKRLMAEAGYPNGEGFPTINYSTNDAGYHKALAEYLQEAWSKIGVKIKVNLVEWSSFTPMRRNGDFEIARNGWVGDYDDPSNLLDLMYSTNGNNDGKFANANFDAQMDLSRATIDPQSRSAALHAAEDVIFQESACIPVAYYNDFWLQSSDVKGIWHSPLGYWYFMYGSL